MTNHLLLSLLLLSSASPSLSQSPPAAKGPQPVSRTVYMSRVDSGFSEIDTNKDGSVDRAEYESAEARAIATRRVQLLKQREANFRQMDKDKSGSLSLSEFNSVIAAEPTRKPNVAPLLTRLDTNKDGKVSMAESRAPASAQFDRLDTNKDGILSVEEQKKAAARPNK